ncbi:helix-turn-helix domain-containing protein [Salisediminibacterium beveridgei]|uniref:XRE Family Transcriptional Regulator n=1 Tax=Salisediminibacterium beveridgei TaxID=632773 RepID=A0A1D7QZK1_9BACI|nr:helix-turn-helix transcriptional regulator [Salisediminibacterium beveridgei]AOM84444.1 XRE Family Transcriptional Regulator [Salisediminibacterium beveridgei]
MSLGENISSKRKALKLSQEYVAGRLGVSRQAVSKWETNSSEPSTDNLIRLANLFKCDIRELISPEINPGDEEIPEIPSDPVKKDIRMQLAAVFGRVLLLIGAIGFMGGITDSADLGSMPGWYVQLWYGVVFAIGFVLTFIGSWDYFNRKAGSKQVIWFDLLFALAIFLYGSWPFEESIKTLITMILGMAVVSIINIKFFIPVWRKPKKA